MPKTVTAIISATISASPPPKFGTSTKRPNTTRFSPGPTKETGLDRSTLGLARVMAGTGLPYIISFVINRRGEGFDGTPLPLALGIGTCAALGVWLTSMIRRDSDD